VKNKAKNISGNKKPAKTAKKKTPPPKKSLLSRQAEKTIKNKPVLKNSAILKKRTTKPLNSKSAEKYLSILDTIEDGYFEVDLAGNFTFLNDSVCRTIGYSREELMGINYRQYTVEENSKMVFQAFNQVYKTGKPLKELGWYIKSKDGSRRYIEGSVSLMKDSSGQPTGFIGIARDITERKRTGDALSASEVRYRRLFESAKDGILILDGNTGRILDVNPFLIELLGYSREQFIRKFVWELGPFKDIIPNRNKFLELQRQGYIRYENLPLETIDGRFSHVEFVSNVYAVDHTKIIQCNIRDITERKNMENKLINSEEKFRMLAESSSFAIMMHQGDHWIYANRAAEEISDYTEEELCGMHFWDIVHPDYREMVKQSGYNRQQGKVMPRAYEFKIIAKNGMEKWVSLTGNPIKYGDKPTALISVTDITERKITEAALKESEDKFRTIFENSSSAMAIIESDTTISMVNKEYCRISLYEEKDVIGMSWTKQLPPEDLKRLEEYNRERLIDPLNAPSNYEFSFYRKDGEIRNGLISVAFLPNTQKIVASFIDITERKRAEEALRESEQRYRDLSIIDDLTQLYNSRHFYAQLEKEMERSNRYGQPLTLLMLDLDKFKDFNDTYGHVQGDYVLSRLGHAIKRSLREIDSAYRYGGEEFTIILPMTMSEEGITTAKRIQKELRKENFSLISGQEVHMTVSIGLAQYKPQEEIKRFVHRVDQFMYKVKKHGRGRICCDDGDLQ
jgi:diguanylate cyclase (GGDEF)-like protein/PAS domain S-box-containing protein